MSKPEFANAASPFQDAASYAVSFRVFPTIKTKLHLFEIGREMLRADLVPRPHDAPLQERERILDRVGVNVTHDVDLAPVIDGPVGNRIREAISTRALHLQSAVRPSVTAAALSLASCRRAARSSHLSRDSAGEILRCAGMKNT